MFVGSPGAKNIERISINEVNDVKRKAYTLYMYILNKNNYSVETNIYFVISINVCMDHTGASLCTFGAYSKKLSTERITHDKILN